MKAYIVTEGQSDSEILKRLLPPEITSHVEFLIGGGRYSIQSFARTLLVVKQLPVAIVIDADTEDTPSIEEQRHNLYDLLDQVSPGIPFDVFFAVPEIESVFFQNRELLEEILDHPFTDVEWEMGKRHPKEILQTILGTSSTPVYDILGHLSNEAVAVLRSHPLIRQIEGFLNSIAILS